MSDQAILSIKVDSFVFTLLSKTLEKFQDSYLYKVTKNEQIDFLSFDKASSTIFADIDPESLIFIIDFIRGYPYYHLDEPLLSKIYYDAERLSIPTLIAKIKSQISETHHQQLVLSDLEQADNIETEQINLDRFLRSLNDVKQQHSMVHPKYRGDSYFTETSEPSLFKFYARCYGNA